MPPYPDVRAVLDTNILVSGLISLQGPPRQVVDAWLAGDFTLATSLYLVEELAHVLTCPHIVERLRLSQEEVNAILAALLAQADMTPGQLSLPGVTRDPKDDAVIACAKEGDADYIVSGDQDLLVLGEYEGIQIVTPRRFVKILASTGASKE